MPNLTGHGMNSTIQVPYKTKRSGAALAEPRRKQSRRPGSLQPWNCPCRKLRAHPPGCQLQWNILRRGGGFGARAQRKLRHQEYPGVGRLGWPRASWYSAPQGSLSPKRRAKHGRLGTAIFCHGRRKRRSQLYGKTDLISSLIVRTTFFSLRTAHSKSTP